MREAERHKINDPQSHNHIETGAKRRRKKGGKEERGEGHTKWNSCTNIKAHQKEGEPIPVFLAVTLVVAQQ